MSNKAASRTALAFGFMALLAATPRAWGAERVAGVAAWYGEDYRGKLMANGQPFNPDKLTAACWHYPLGTRVRVSCAPGASARAVMVTVTDRGPAERLRAQGRVIDLSHAAFRALASPNIGLIRVVIEPEGEVVPLSTPKPAHNLAAFQPARAVVRREIGQKAGFIR